MDGEQREEGLLRKLDRVVFGSIDRKLGIEAPPDTKIIYQYPKTGDYEVWVELLTKETPFKEWYYSVGPVTDPANIRTIPESTARSVIHFVPPEALEARKRIRSEEDSWLDDPEFNSQSVPVMRRNIAAFTGLLQEIRDGRWKGADHIIGVTNYRMANFAVALGFQRCWEYDKNNPPADLAMPMTDESRDYRVGTSVADLVQRYDLNKQVPTEASVLKVIQSSRPLQARQPVGVK